MDPTPPPPPPQYFTAQDWVAVLSTQQQQITELQRLLHAAITSRSQTRSEPKVPLPEAYNGSRQAIRGFINQIRLVISQRPQSYGSDAQRVALVGSLLQGSALAWFSPLFENRDPLLSNFEHFIRALKDFFDDPNRQRTAASRLQSIRQGRRPVSSYATDFQLLLADAGWDNVAAMHLFKAGLNSDVKDLLLSLPEPTELQALITQAINCDERIYQRRQEQQAHQYRHHTSTTPTSSSSSSPTPMQLDGITVHSAPNSKKHHHSRLPTSERQRRIDAGLCLYCGAEGHVVTACSLSTPPRPAALEAVTGDLAVSY